MNVVRTLLRPVARMAGWHAGQQLRAFLAAHRRTPQVQEQLLGRLMAAAADSDFGRDHGFGRIRSYADFVSAVPVGDYETHRPYVQRVLQGQVQALFAPGTKVLMFAVTSGTTGAPKHIPVTRQFMRDYHRGWNVFGMKALRDHPSAWLRKIVTIASSAREGLTPAGVPCGSISGMLAERQKRIVRWMYPVPGCVRELRDPAGKFYAILRASVTQDVAMLTTANPSSAVKLAETARDQAERLIRDVRDGTCNPPGELPDEMAGRFSFRPDPAGARRLERIRHAHGELLPRYFWKLALLCHWTGGTVGLYLPRIRRLYGDVPVRDIGLLASEGRLSVPLTDETPAGVAEISSNFLEFLPVPQSESPRPDVLRAHELEVGREYFVVLSNWAGMYRYNINDRVRVTGRLGQSPVFEFLSRGLHTCSITGEKLTEHQVVEAMARAHPACGGSVETFILQGHFDRQPYYELRVEPGSFARFEAGQIALCRGRSEQYKHKYLMTDVIDDGRR